MAARRLPPWQCAPPRDARGELGVPVDVRVRGSDDDQVVLIASGGVRSLDDVRTLASVADEGIVGAITGRAIYEGALDLAEGQRLADELTSGS